MAYEILSVTLALFFARTVFIGYKYLFFVLIVPFFICCGYLFHKNEGTRFKWSKLILPAFVAILFFIHFKPYSNVVKESINLCFILVSLPFLKHLSQNHILKLLMYFVLFAGLIAIARFTSIQIGIPIPISNILFEGNGLSLVNDYNFYSLFFILAIIIAEHLHRMNEISTRVLFVIDAISFINIIACTSRRGYALYVILLAVLILFYLLKDRGIKHTLLFNVILISIVAIIGSIALIFSNVLYSPNMHTGTKLKLYKLSSLLDNSTSFPEFEIKRQRAFYQDQPTNDNIFYNGDLKFGLNDWGSENSPNDCINIDLISENGTNSIKITRSCSSYYWQIKYLGRPIVYHKNVTYDLSFKYKIIEGSNRPFCVGWYIFDNNSCQNDIPQKITRIDSIWNRCEVSYKFKKTHFNPTCFLNSLKAGSTIEVKDIRLTCDDTTGLPWYVDQLPDSVIHKHYASADTINYLTHTRTDRWRYAWELWQTKYSTTQKIFGHGFDYLEWYGEKFHNNPKRYDFPHNPIISSFLYSGIVGGVVYIWFLIMSLWLYWKKRKQLGTFFIMYLCCMFFCMFSGSSHFSFPLFAFLSFLPFVEMGKDPAEPVVQATE